MVEGIGPLLEYLWGRLPLVLLFANGYLIYRLLVVTGLTEAFVRRMLHRAGGRLSRVLLAVISSAALLSFFIPNAVTMLTVLPVLALVDREYKRAGTSLTTPLTLAAIYGANIGGMGSLIGSPANLILIGALDFFRVPGREKITFFNWFLWSIPLVALLVLGAWGLLILYYRSTARVAARRTGAPGPLSGAQSSGLRVFGAFLGFWVAQAVLLELWPGFSQWRSWACAGFFLLFVHLSFVRRPAGLDRPLLAWLDVVRGLPGRGLLLLALLGVIIAVVRLMGLDSWAAGALGGLLAAETSGFAIFFSTTLAVIFLTEVLSNTVVSAAFFAVAHQAALAHGLDPLGLMIAVSIASTCAFMTPIATPCNALAFGEMKGTKLTTMLGLGLALNIFGALLMTVWLTWIIPLVY